LTHKFNFGNLILERGENYDKEGCHGHMRKGAFIHWVSELTEAVENFFFKILIVLTMISVTQVKWGT
jgi:hypothetical protein